MQKGKKNKNKKNNAGFLGILRVKHFDLIWEFYGPVNTKVMLSSSDNLVTLLQGRLSPLSG